MCGIMGYIGKKNADDAVQVLLEGLTRQEYRGYDSAGLACALDDSIEVIKVVGRVCELKDKIEDMGAPSSHIGIGHTRWATHGGVTETNAHPHESCCGRITLVHNGIIENAKEIRNALEQKGLSFHTETDTEAAAQLLGDIYRGDALAAMTELCSRLAGAFALVVLFSDKTDELWCARSGSPLVTAFTEEAGFAASDPTALLEYTHDLFFLDEGEMARVTAGGAQFFGFDGAEHGKEPLLLDWDSVMSEKGIYEHFMRKEIDEEPEVLRVTTQAYTEGNCVALEKALQIPAADIKNLKRVHFVACGTSHYATLVAANVMEMLGSDLDIHISIASEYRYRNVLGGRDTLVILVSQSGETADTLAAARLARSRGSICIAVTNSRGSTIDRETEHTLLSLSGPEIGVAATKTFMGQMSILTLLALHILKMRGNLTASDEHRLVTGIRTLPAKIVALLADEPHLAALAAKYRSCSGFFFIGRRECVPLTLEGALKLKEIAYVHSEAYAAGELKHGPIAMLDNTSAVLAFAPAGELREKTLSNVAECRARDAQILLFASAGDREAEEQATDVIYLPPAEPELIPFVGVIPLQLFAYHVARELGRDIDMPRNLAKSVTVE